MLRDLEDLGAFAVVVLALPIAAAVVARSGSRLGLAGLAVSAALGALWFFHYALDRANPGLAGALVALVGVFAGWALVLAGAYKRYRSRHVASRAM